MPIPKITFTLVLLLLGASAFAQEDHVRVIENGTPKEILIPDFDEDATLIQKIRFYYANQGYLDVSITDSTHVSTGSIYKISEVIILSDDSLTSVFRSFEGQVFNNRLVEKELATYHQKMISEGYLHAVVEIERLKKDSLQQTVQVYVKEQKGRLVYISNVRYSGNKLNTDAFINKISFWKDSLVASSENILLIKRHILGTELFEDVSIPQIFTENGKISALVYVQERQLNSLDGLIGYVPDSNGKGQLVGDLTISLWNVLNEGNGFDLLYQRLKPETSRLNVGISQYWLAGLPIDLGLEISLYQNDTTYQTRKLTLSTDYRISTNLKLTSKLFTETSNSTNNDVLQREPGGKKQGADLGFVYQNLDRMDVPTKGINFGVSYGIANKDVEDDSLGVFRQQNISMGFNSYIPLFRNTVIAGRIKGFYVAGESFSESDLIRFGGANSLRGYSEEQFLASKLVWGDVEYRFLTDQSSYIFLFGATGFYERPRLMNEMNQSFSQKDWLYSGGLGLSYKTAIGRLTFSYAVSSTQTLSNGKVHFGIRTKL